MSDEKKNKDDELMGLVTNLFSDLNKRLDNIQKSIDKNTKGIEKNTKGILKNDKSILSLENNLKPKLDILFETREDNTKKLDEVLNRLDILESKVENQELELKVIKKKKAK